MMHVLFPIVKGFFDILHLVVFVRVILSWISHDHYHPLIKLVYSITEPLFEPLRGKVAYGGFDFSPIVVLFLINMVRNFVLGLMVSF